MQKPHQNKFPTLQLHSNLVYGLICLKFIFFNKNTTKGYKCKNILILELKRLKNYCKKNYHSKQRKSLCLNFIIEKAFAI